MRKYKNSPIYVGSKGCEIVINDGGAAGGDYWSQEYTSLHKLVNSLTIPHTDLVGKKVS